MSAAQVSVALAKLPLADLDIVVIENVGNLVCPSAFELGESGKVAVLSVAEGDDKPAKYPAICAKSKVLLINKVDLLDSAQVDFDVDKVKADARRWNSDLAIFEISAKIGQGMPDNVALCEALFKQSHDLMHDRRGAGDLGEVRYRHCRHTSCIVPCTFSCIFS